MFDFSKLTARRQAKSQGQIVQLGTLNSTLKGFVNIFDTTGAAVTNVALDTWTKLNTNSVEGFTSNDFITSTNRVTSTKKRRIVKLNLIVSVISGSNNIIHIAFFKTGNIIASTEQDLTTSSNGEITIPIQGITEVLPGDYIEVWVKNEAHTTPVTLNHFNVIVAEL
jgi:hypothetical protein